MAQDRPRTLKDIAEHVGVSKMAVSAVLGNTCSSASVSAATRSRILNAAQELGYQPNAIARALRSRRTNVIGFYTGYRYLDPRSPFVAAVIAGLQSGCTEHGKDLLLHTAFSGSSAEAIFSALADGRIEGLVMTAPPDDPLVERLARSGLPVVAVADEIPSFPSVCVDDAEGAALLVEYLAEQGHRRLLYRGPDRYLVSAACRRDTVFRLAAARGHSVAEVMGPPAAVDDPALRRWRETEAAERPTACLCWNDRAAYELLAQCHRQGIRVPEDLAVTGFDGDPNPAFFCFRLTTVRAPWAAAANLAVKLLVARMEGDDVPRRHVLPVELCAGITA